MNRTDRLYAIVEELRAVAPRLRTARQLAQRHSVSLRTIERDIAALQQAGIPIYADVGRRGGYALEKSMSLPPLNFTAAETVALAVALARNRGGPFDHAGRSALHKVLAAMSDRNAAAARDLAARVRLVEPLGTPPDPELPPVIGQAIERGLVLRMGYLDQHGRISERAIEPVELVNGQRGWYLIAWCRLRGGFRVFRLDRMRDLTLTDLLAPIRPREGYPSGPSDHQVRAVGL
ncbi:helix-turn-helix transcriptional regulator [Nocardia sp. NPDC127579]|uniref:helix-turn-helix transcriptional regulator n=1 Tax=Nocardia sp. NPDC127579 TaxID=3345402 RepID=UPI00363C3411